MKSVALRSSALVGSKAVQDVLTSLLFILLARTDPSGYGLIVLGLSVAMLLRSLQSLGLDQFTLRELSSSQISQGQILRQMAKIKIVIACCMVLLFLAYALLQQWALQHVIVVSVLLIGQCFEGVADTFFNLLRAEGESINESICRTGPNIVAATYGAGCLLFHLDIMFFALLFLFGGAMKLGLAVYSARRLCFDSLLTGDVFVFGRSMLTALVLISIISFMGTFYNEIQIFWLKRYYTFTDVAHYRVAQDVMSFVCAAVAHLVVGAVLFPLLTKTFSSGDRTRFCNLVRSYLKKIVIGGSGVAFFLGIFGGSIVLLIYGNQYLIAKTLVPVLGLAALFSFINNFIIYVLLAMRREYQVCFYLLFPVTLSFLLGPSLVAGAGPMGAACALLFSRAILTIVLIISLQKHLQFFRLKDYKVATLGWIVGGVTFGLFLQLNYFLAGGLALLVFLLFVMIEQRGLIENAEQL